MSGWGSELRPSQLMMIGENRHLTDNATLNKHHKATSEASTLELPIPTNHTLVIHHPPTPLANQRELVRPPPGPLSATLQTFKRATSKHLHSSRSPSPLLTLAQQLLSPTFARPRLGPAAP